MSDGAYEGRTSRESGPTINRSLVERQLEDAEKKLDVAVEEILELRTLNGRLEAQAKLLKLESDCAAVALESYEQTISDQAAELTFWKSAAEQGLRLWERAVDDADKLRDGIEVALSSSSTALSYENWTRLEILLDE